MTIEQEYLEKYINPRIRKLFEQANGQFYISPGNQTPRFVFQHNDMLDFVDLIVQECVAIANRQFSAATGLDDRDCLTAQQMKQHFGVEP